MGFMVYLSSLIPTLIVVAVAFADSSHAGNEALSAQVYWHKVFPDTPMPSFIQSLLRPGQPTQVNRKMNYIPYTGQSSVQSIKIRYFGYKNHYGSKKIHYSTQNIPTADIRDLAGLFFLEKDLVPGSMENLEFITTSYSAAFLPRKVAESIPFSSDKLEEVLAKFSVVPNSDFAKSMKETLEDCEGPAAKGDIKRCATSLESMVDFSVSALGTSDLRAVTTEVPVKKDGSSEKQSSWAPVTRVQKLPSSKLVACHLVPYPYAVFYCHTTGRSRIYNVALTRNDGAVVDAVAVCHIDTSTWSPDHISFKLLKVKPGTVPICHFITQNNIIWTSRV